MELGGTTAVVTTGIAIGGGFLGMAWKADDLVSKEVRKDLSLWLLGIEPENVEKSIHRWPTHFAALFDRVFGEKHLSWRCFGRSSVASFLALVLCTLIFTQVAPGEWAASGFSGYVDSFVGLAFAAVIFNLIPDYVSLLETRFIIRKLQTARSFLRQVAWLLVDFVATFLIFALLLVVLLGLDTDGGVIENVRTIVDAGRLDGSSTIKHRVLAIFLWTTYFTSVWVWLYFLAQLLMRSANSIRKSVAVLQYALPIEDRPLRAVGEVMALIACLGYWSLMLPMSVFGGEGSAGYIEPEMVTVSPGSFLMGTVPPELYDNESPQHKVTIAKPFAIGKYEVTFREYDRFAEATGRAKLSDRYWDGGREQLPVVPVTWSDARDYAAWLSERTGKRYRLPTEAEWEYAARAGTTTSYWWGDDIGRNRAVCDGCGSQWDDKQPAPVGSFDANPFGLNDTVGNVWEWMQDCWHGSYHDAPTDGSAWEDEGDGNCPRRMLRGGSWNSEPWDLRSAFRYWGHAGLPDISIGFRLARDM